MITIPDEMVLGVRTASSELDCHTVGGMAPNEKSRKAKIARLKRSSDEVTIIDNVPIPGFTLASRSSGMWRYRSKSDNFWTVIDPRGYKYSVSSDNVIDIVSCTGITEGMIQSKCVLGYDSGELVLLPVNSQLYMTAKANTNLVTNRVHLRDVARGDKVLLQNKVEGIYLGGWYDIQVSNTVWSEDKEKLAVPKYTYLIRIEDSDGSVLGYYTSNTIKISSITKKCETPLCVDDITTELYNELQLRSRFSSSTHYALNKISNQLARLAHNRSTVIYLPKKKNNITLDVQEIEWNEVLETNATYGPRICEDASNNRFKIEYFTTSNSSKALIRKIQSLNLSDKELVWQPNVAYNHRQAPATSSSRVDVTTMSKYYKIIYKLDNKII